jgi:hypothetical protein
MGLEFNFVKVFFIVLTMNFYIKVKFFKEKKNKTEFRYAFICSKFLNKKRNIMDDFISCPICFEAYDAKVCAPLLLNACNYRDE